MRDTPKIHQRNIVSRNQVLAPTFSRNKKKELDILGSEMEAAGVIPLARLDDTRTRDSLQLKTSSPALQSLRRKSSPERIDLAALNRRQSGSFRGEAGRGLTRNARGRSQSPAKHRSLSDRLMPLDRGARKTHIELSPRSENPKQEKRSPETPLTFEESCKILGLDKGATDHEIKRAYRKLAIIYLPEKNPGDDTAAQRFKDILAAYERIDDLNRLSNSVNENPTEDIVPETLSRPFPTSSVTVSNVSSPFERYGGMKSNPRSGRHQSPFKPFRDFSDSKKDDRSTTKKTKSDADIIECVPGLYMSYTISQDCSNDLKAQEIGKPIALRDRNISLRTSPGSLSKNNLPEARKRVKDNNSTRSLMGDPATPKSPVESSGRPTKRPISDSAPPIKKRRYIPGGPHGAFYNVWR